MCTFFELPSRIPEGRAAPFPIGMPCFQARTRVIDQEGGDVPQGAEGELCVSGATVMCGYWNRSRQTEEAFLWDDLGERWYQTGDIVAALPDGNYRFVGRKDRMVKRRGYRVELGEVESALHRHPAVSEAAAVAFLDDDSITRIRAFVGCLRAQRPSIIDLKRFCKEELPEYMIPDIFCLLSALPRTSTGKVDYRALTLPQP